MNNYSSVNAFGILKCHVIFQIIFEVLFDVAVVSSLKKASSLSSDK